MEIDPTVIIIIVILVIIGGIFIGTQMGGSATGNVIKSSSAPVQYSGGGCGR